ncbi:MAG: hypothetical protein ACLPZF_23280, partial [Candidatus Acidiferrales bacterium]
EQLLCSGLKFTDNDIRYSTLKTMYTDFYKLNRNPFEITPDPYFLYSTKKHKEALAALYYGVRQRKGFVVLTGEVCVHGF